MGSEFSFLLFTAPEGLVQNLRDQRKTCSAFYLSCLIHISFRCDSVKDCPDGEDDSHPVCLIKKEERDNSTFFHNTTDTIPCELPDLSGSKS